MVISYVFWLSIFGSLTGFAGLTLHFWRFLQERPKINVYFAKDELGKTLIGYVTSKHMNSHGFYSEDTSMFTFYIWTRISNQSDKPISFLEFNLHIPNLGLFCLDSSSNCNASVMVSQKGSILIAPIIKPVFTLEPYSAIEGYLFFGPYQAIPSGKTKAKLSIMTTRKIFSTKLIIDPIIPPLPADT